MGLITSDLGGEQNLVYLRDLPKVFKQGPDINSNRKLRGLSIFSGGGSLDRGLEEGGAVKFHTAVDFSLEACHTQRANVKDPEAMQIYCGSVDDYLDALLKGQDLKPIARVGEVDFIAAGSPCPGFSSLQNDWLSPKSLQNASHISTFCSFVDVYRPLYGILENVVNMASTRKGYEDQNVLSQVVASLVSMGYQVNQYIMDAWCYSSKQQRSRLILTIAAPGLNPILQPWHTNRRAHEDTKGRCLGWLPNGERFGQRQYYPTPFAHVPAGAVSAGLPAIGNSLVQTCVPFPDHRLPASSTRDERVLLTCIPKNPPGCGYGDAERLGLLPKRLPDKSNGRPYTRIKKAGLIPTITTSVTMRAKYNGASVHWGEDRSISILEARRAQGYPDDEPIIGNLRMQYQIVGNGVDRKVAFAMGLSLFHATEKNASEYTANRSHDHMSIIPPNERAAKRIYSLTLRPERPNTFTELISEVDGASEASSRIPGPPQSSGLLPCFPPNLNSSMGRLSLSSSSNVRVSAAPTKRIREEDIEEAVITTDSHSNKRPKKRAKSSDLSQSSAVAASSTYGWKSLTALQSRSERSASSSGKRRTRHSGLAVEFEPKQWNKRPEVEHYDCR